jgi:hypothetical protein
MKSLRRTERSVLALLGIISCVAAAATLANDARGAVDVPARGYRVASIPHAARYELPRRDPFAGDPALRAPATPPAAALTAASPNLSIGIPLGVRAVSSLSAPEPARVAATVTGTRPLAVIGETGSPARIVTIGDPVGASFVLAIDAGGVHLADGTLLRLTP